MEQFEYAVVGRGMIGSAAARYLANISKSVVVIGPDEPLDWPRHTGVFASHYDQGRITRILDTDEVWATLAQRSISRYRLIEEESGIKFFFDVGFLKTASTLPEGLSYLSANENVSRKLNADFQSLDYLQLENTFPFLRFSHESKGLFEKAGGYINPRDLVLAQLTIADKLGVCQVHETVEKIVESKNSIQLCTTNGGRYSARRVLIAVGSFANCLSLTAKKLNTTLRAETTLLAKVDQALVKRLSGMPSMVYKLDKNPCFSYVYVLPPIKYPDGHYYVKIGGDNEGYLAADESEIQRWFHSNGDPSVGNRLRDILISIMPILERTETCTKPCIFSDTPSQRPYIDELLAKQIYVVTGCCGASAKSSDELGRIAKEIIVKGVIDDVYEKSCFKAIFVGQSQPRGRD